jgi:hypothetical protein
MGRKSKELSEDRKQLDVDLKREGHRNCEIVSLVLSLKTLPRFFFTVLNNLTSPRRVTFLGRPTLGMFSTLPVETTFLVSGTTEMDC